MPAVALFQGQDQGTRYVKGLRLSDLITRECIKGGCAGMRHFIENFLPVFELPSICKGRIQEGTLFGSSVGEFIVS